MPTTATAPHRLTTLASLIAACLLLATPMLQAQTGDAQYFTEVAPGVVKDSRTGLEWMRCSLGKYWRVSEKRCVKMIGRSIVFTWQGAQDAAKKLNATGGYEDKADWRVPTILELQSIRYCSTGKIIRNIASQVDGSLVETGGCNDSSTTPTIDVTTFPDTLKLWYWSSTPSRYASHVWGVDFSDGDIGGYDLRYSDVAVRLVR